MPKLETNRTEIVGAKDAVSLMDYHLCRLTIADLDEICVIEDAVYTHPWTRGNFLDSLYSQHEAWGLRRLDGRLIGYFFAMLVLDELHLLTIAVAQNEQGKAWGLQLLKHLFELARRKECVSILLEVRVSNQRAIHIYQRFGFVQVGRRKAYYPAHQGVREDALLMQLILPQHEGGQ